MTNRKDLQRRIVRLADAVRMREDNKPVTTHVVHVNPGPDHATRTQEEALEAYAAEHGPVPSRDLVIFVTYVEPQEHPDARTTRADDAPQENAAAQTTPEAIPPERIEEAPRMADDVTRSNGTAPRIPLRRSRNGDGFGPGSLRDFGM